MQSADLEKCRQRLTSRLPLVGAWVRNQAVRQLKNDGSAEAAGALAATAAAGANREIRAASLDALCEVAGEGNVHAQEAVCRLFIHHNLSAAREIALAEKYAPREETRRALFFFLTEQWERYESLDFDHRLLRAAYEASDDRLRHRVAATARAAGRLEWVDIAAGGRQGDRLAEMTDCEWNGILNLLEESDSWEKMWRLAQEAPPKISAGILRKLHDAGWSPQGDDRTAFQEILALAQKWEERDLQASLHCFSVLRGHRDEVRFLAFTPDSQLLASASGDKTIGLWSLNQGGEHRVLEGQLGQVKGLAITPNGRLLITVSRQGHAQLWTLPAAKPHSILKGHDSPIFCLAVTPDGQILATGSGDATVQLWRLPDGKTLNRLEGHEGAITAMAVSPEGDILASGSADGTIRLWSLPEGKLLKKMDGHHAEETDGVLSLAISPNAEILASGGVDRKIRLWSLPGGQSLGALRGHQGAVGCLVVSPDGKMLVSGSSDHRIRLWHLPDGRNLATLIGHASDVSSLAIRGDGKFLVSASGSGLCADHTARLWSLPGGESLKTLYGHNRYISSLAISPDGLTVATGGGDRSVRVWTSELDRLSRLPVRDSRLQDLARAQKMLQEQGWCEAEKNILEFITALIRRQRRVDIHVDEAGARLMEMGEFDIEIEG